MTVRAGNRLFVKPAATSAKPCRRYAGNDRQAGLRTGGRRKEPFLTSPFRCAVSKQFYEFGAASRSGIFRGNKPMRRYMLRQGRAVESFSMSKPRDFQINAGILLCLAAVFAIPRMAVAGGWQYCLAPSYGQHKVYVSEPFPMDAAPSVADNVFEKRLMRAGARFTDVQCPRAGDRQAIETMRRYAIAWNRQLGRTVVRLSWREADRR